jgi:ribosomal protein RSM22 (predicted rRNA methylase)
MGMTAEGATVLQLKRIADALEFTASQSMSKYLDLNSEASTLFQLAGNAAGFADELDSILSMSDMFQRVKSLRDLQKKARRIANMYQEQAKQASTKADSEVESENGESKAGIGEEIQGGSP